MKEKKKNRCVALKYLGYDFVRFNGWPGLIFFRPKKLYISNEAKKPIKGGAILVSNHISLVDPMYLMITFWKRRHHFVAMKDLFEGRFNNWLFTKVFLALKIDRENMSIGAFKDIINHLKNDDLVKGILDKRYTICTGYQGNANYNKDKRDGLLENTDFGSPTYWHAVNAIRSVNDNPVRIKDNYYKSISYNIYDVAHRFSDLSCFYDKGYVITKVAEDALEEVKRLNEFRTNLLKAIEINSAMRHQTNDQNYKSILHYTNEKNRKKLQDCEEQLKKYL